MQQQRQIHSSEIQPMSLSLSELNAIARMAECHIVYAEAADKTFGSSGIVQTRAVSAMIQAKCEREIMRQQLMAHEAAQQQREKESSKTVQSAKHSDAPDPEPSSSKG